jgi:hypothetical protein
MTCEKFKFTASAYIDRQLAPGEAGDYRAHLSMCADCRLHFRETMQASLLLRGVERPEPPRELHDYVVRAVERRTSKDFTLAERAYDWVLKLNPLPVSYAAGVVVSAVMFTLMMFALKPIQVIGWDKPVEHQAVFIAEQVTGTEPEFRSYNDLPPDSDAPDEDYYVLPRVLNDSALVGFSHLAYHKPGPEGMAAIVEVKSDGRAELVEVLGERNDPDMVNQLWWSLTLSKRTFQPAFVNGKPVSTRIVLLVEKVDVSG